MDHIGGFLGRFLKIKNKVFLERNIFSESVYSVSGIKIQPEEIEIKDGTALVQSSPAVKNELFLKKAEILKHFNSLSEEKIRDIR